MLEAGKLDDDAAALKATPTEEPKLNQLGYNLIERDVTKAIAVLRLNATAPRLRERA